MTAGKPTQDEPGDFWRLEKVKEVTGLSKTTIYRRIKDGSFPDSRPYRHLTAVFWLESDIREWQRREVSS
jgi:prophage regulatory protein